MRARHHLLLIRHALLCILWLPLLALAAELIPPDQAFRFTAESPDARTVDVRFTIEEGYYLYRERLAFEAAGAKLGAAQLPAGKKKHDETFGDVEVYRNELVARVPVEDAGGQQTLKLKVTSQGCADVGVCFPKQSRIVDVKLGPAQAAGASATGGAKPAAPLDESGRIAQLLRGSGWLTVTGAFFGIGVLIAFTPCMFPMIPIVSSIVLGRKQAVSRGRATLLVSVYVLAMALAYAAAGVAAGLSGAMISASLQNPWVLGTFALVFVLLALSMFGFYELQLPTGLQSKLSDASSHQHGGSVLGVAAMGLLSALIVGPCVAAPLAGALIYIAQTGDARLGGLALFAMGVGSGVPMMAFVLSAHHALPKSGPWMEAVKKFFGVMLLAVAVWIVSPVLPGVAVMLAWAALLIFSAIYLHALDPLPPHAHGWQRFGKGAGVVALIVGAALLLGALAGSRDPLQPLAALRGGAAAPAEHAPPFARIKSVAELEQRVAAAGRPVMLDFYADWCVSCKEMERFTFADPAVKARLGNLLLLQADVTATTDDDRALLARFGLFGPPGIVFFGRDGKEIDGLRVVGFQNAADFTQVLDRALAPASAAN